MRKYRSRMNEEEKARPYSISFKPELLQKLKECSKETRIPMAQIIAIALENYFQGIDQSGQDATRQ